MIDMAYTLIKIDPKFYSEVFYDTPILIEYRLQRQLTEYELEMFKKKLIEIGRERGFDVLSVEQENKTLKITLRPYAIPIALILSFIANILPVLGTLIGVYMLIQKIPTWAVGVAAIVFAGVIAFGLVQLLRSLFKRG